MRAALKKQIALLNSITDAPEEVGRRIVKEAAALIKRGALPFLRWNGVGDLTPETRRALEYVARALPNLPLWVVTRKPAEALALPPLSNLFIHFSLDTSSLDRLQHLIDAQGHIRHPRLFFSYTADEGEAPDVERLKALPLAVYFSNLYREAPPEQLARVSCPLNSAEEVKGACLSCGRCWSDEALSLSRTPHA